VAFGSFLKERGSNPGTFVLFLILSRHLVNTDMQARFQTVSRADAGMVGNGGRDRSLNFYSCANETAIFRSIKWALKLSGQFLRQDVLLFSSTAIVVAATPSRRASPLFNAFCGPSDGRKSRAPFRGNPLQITSNEST